MTAEERSVFPERKANLQDDLQTYAITIGHEGTKKYSCKDTDGFSHHGIEPSRCEGGAEPGIQVARIETVPVPLVTLLAILRPLKKDARAVMGA